MEKFPLSPLGAQQLLDALYRLPGPELAAEAAQAGSDFKNWVRGHFHLSEKQETYLRGIPDVFTATAAQKTHEYLLGKLPILLVMPDDDWNDGDEDVPGKEFDLDERSNVHYAAANRTTVSKSLVFTFSYPAS